MTHAIIFSAGFGSRLLPLTKNLPKALVQVKGRPILEWNIRNLIHFGVTKIFINTHYLHELIEEFIQKSDFEVPVTICHEPEILGTGGGLYNLRQYSDDPSLLICNVDTLCTANINHFYKYHCDTDTLVTLAVNHIESNSMFLIDQTQKLVGWRKNGADIYFQDPDGLVSQVGFAGWHFVSHELFTIELKEIPFSIRDLYFQAIKSGIQISTWNIEDAYWIDIGTLDSLKVANQSFPGFNHLPDMLASSSED